MNYFASTEDGRGQRITNITIQSGREKGSPKRGKRSWFSFEQKNRVLTKFIREKDDGSQSTVIGVQVNRFVWIAKRYPILMVGALGVILLSSMSYMSIGVMNILSVFLLINGQKKVGLQKTSSVFYKGLYILAFVLPALVVSLFVLNGNLQFKNTALQIIIFGYLSVYSVVTIFTLLQRYKKVWRVAENVDALNQVFSKGRSSDYIWLSEVE